MTERRVRRQNWPLWVKVGLFGLPTRTFGWVSFWICMALAAVCTFCGFIDWLYFVGTLGMLVAAWGYYMCVRWVDKNGRWS